MVSQHVAGKSSSMRQGEQLLDSAKTEQAASGEALREEQSDQMRSRFKQWFQ